MNYKIYKTQLEQEGYVLLDHIYTPDEVDRIVEGIEGFNAIEKKTEDIKTVFAIRQFLKKAPELKQLLFNEKLEKLIGIISDDPCFLSKSIYFDKPKGSNWFVGYHQDISISVREKTMVEGYTHWTFKKGQYGVQPPLEVLNDTFTLRIHLDDTNADNGALKVIPRSHKKGIYRADTIHLKEENEQICSIKRGGVMLMKPLTMHASGKTTNGQRRRVVHLEFCKQSLAPPLEWLEKMDWKAGNT